MAAPSIVTFSEKQYKSSYCHVTASTDAQQETETECEPFFVHLPRLPPSQIDHLRHTGLLDPAGHDFDVCLLRDQHARYLRQVWSHQQPSLRAHFCSLDASRAWMIYWTLHACDLLDQLPSNDIGERIVYTLQQFWTPATVTIPQNRVGSDSLLQTIAPVSIIPDRGSVFQGGGFGGGPGQLPHAATNYAAVLALCILSETTASALRLLHKIRLPLYAWFVSLQDETGGFRMHHDGEIDARASYCVVSIAKLMNLLPADSILRRPEAVDYLARCQTFEGGFGGEPFAEAHGGYAFCATAALYIMQGLDRIDIPALLGWLVRRQMPFEGGFNGRSNKLVDGCYSFWQGGANAILSGFIMQNETLVNATDSDPWLNKCDEEYSSCSCNALFDEGMLERYILLCAQDMNGGLRDKPSKSRDFYHSCYNLSGLSVAQHWGQNTFDIDGKKRPTYGHSELSMVARTHPVYNIRVERTRYILSQFLTK